MSQLGMDIKKRGWVDEITDKLKFANNNKNKYKVETICDNAVYMRELQDHLSDLYYLVSWESYSEAKNTYELARIV